MRARERERGSGDLRLGREQVHYRRLGKRRECNAEVAQTQVQQASATDKRRTETQLQNNPKPRTAKALTLRGSGAATKKRKGPGHKQRTSKVHNKRVGRQRERDTQPLARRALDRHSYWGPKGLRRENRHKSKPTTLNTLALKKPCGSLSQRG